MDYEVIRSNRKTVAICVRSDGSVVVRAPRRARPGEIEAIVAAKERWICKSREKLEIMRSDRKMIALTPKETAEAKRQLKACLEQRCAYFASKMGVDYRQIKVGSAAARWGSCTSQGNLNFTYRLFFAPPELVDYVVVHELAHRREMNHSPRFWNVVAGVLPDYQKRREALREFQRKVEIMETKETTEVKRGNKIEKKQSLF